MPLNFVKALKFFVDYFDGISLRKKFYLFLILIIIGLFFLIKYYENRIAKINSFHNNRYDNVVHLYEDKLEKCHSENKEQYSKILFTLQNALEESHENAIKTEQNRIELEKIKK